MLSPKIARRDLRVLWFSVVLILFAALVSLFSHHYSSILGMVAGGTYVVYRFGSLIPRRFKGDSPLRLILLFLMLLALLYGLLGFGRELFALILLLGLDFLILYRIVHGRPNRRG